MCDPGPGPELDTLCRRAAEMAGVSGTQLRSLRLRSGDRLIELEWHSPVTRGAAVDPPGVGEPVQDAATADDVTLHHICAPLVGTFYRAPAPGAAPFVRAGDVVQVGQQVGIVEAMKLMNPVEADCAGRVVEVLVGDGQPVEYEQRLFAVARDDD